eukprot:CAMPEP_0176005674 /NCGR_PEP_ID=MMETSP0120_2-20121206/2328_1 /TAXON_ID=160619 /ORGANISM="Kryptoperidinium foliaceum, Strain CCMP 1326" /LENGTH=182 /DNA_ID=CAMNT_0017338389 /DNA_START=19 /DNA_END=565 /DNA_ORIENTATION=-
MKAEVRRVPSLRVEGMKGQLPKLVGDGGRAQRGLENLGAYELRLREPPVQFEEGETLSAPIHPDHGSNGKAVAADPTPFAPSVASAWHTFRSVRWYNRTYWWPLRTSRRARDRDFGVTESSSRYTQTESNVFSSLASSSKCKESASFLHNTAAPGRRPQQAAEEAFPIKSHRGATRPRGGLK